jgi:glycosyltransferase involved in cell wall biosynthesis
MSAERDGPLVSVIVPTYNRASLIAPAVRSILVQSFTDLEVLVIDDASTDETDRIVRAIDDDRVSYHRRCTNGGQAAARNDGLRKARGEFLGFLDSDDRWAPGKLERFMSIMRAAPPEVGCVYSDMRRLRADGSAGYFRSPTIARGGRINPDTGWYQTSMLATQATMIPRRWLDAVGPFDEALRFYEDLELLMRLAVVADFVHIREPLTDYVETPDSVITNQRERRRARERILRRHGRAIARESPGFIGRECLGILRARLGA